MQVRGTATRLFRDPLVTSSGGNVITPTSKIVITITADNVNAAAISSFNLFSGRGDTSFSDLPAGLSVSGDYADWGNLQDYLKNVPMLIQGMSLKTSDTDNFGYRMTLFDTNPNRANEKSTYVDLVDYRQPAGNSYADSLNVPASALTFYSLPTTVFQMQIKKNTNIRITLNIGGVLGTVTVTPKQF